MDKFLSGFELVGLMVLTAVILPLGLSMDFAYIIGIVVLFAGTFGLVELFDKL